MPTNNREQSGNVQFTVDLTNTTALSAQSNAVEQMPTADSE